MDETKKLHTQLRNNFGLFGGLSLIFGLAATILFYKANLGLNSFIFTLVMVLILLYAAKKLNIAIRRDTLLCFLGVILLGLSNVLSSSGILQFYSSIGILLLLELSLIKLFCEEKVKGFIDYIGNIFLLPFKALASIGLLFVDGNRYVKNRNIIKSERLRNVLIGCLIAIPILVVTIALLSSADVVFGKITGSIFEWIFYRDFYIILLMILMGAVLCYSLLCGASRDSFSTDKNRTKANSTIGITLSSLLLLVYILFCGIQIIYLFTGGLFTLPGEFTYAEYARRGFFELLAVTCFNILLILVCDYIFEESKWLKGILAAITACTYIMIASASYRMILYIRAYHLTILRLFVLLFLLIDALLLIGVIISIYKKDFPLFGYGVLVISVCYLIFSYSKPDYHIAKYFISHEEEITDEDISFLTRELSYDAAPVVIPFLKGHYEYNIYENINPYYERLADRTDTWDIREYNFSYDRASKLMKQY